MPLRINEKHVDFETWQYQIDIFLLQQPAPEQRIIQSFFTAVWLAMKRITKERPMRLVASIESDDAYCAA